MIFRGLSRKARLVFTRFLLLVFIVIIVVWQLSPTQSQLVQQESNYAIHIRQNFNRSGFYPLAQIPSPNLLWGGQDAIGVKLRLVPKYQVTFWHYPYAVCEQL